MVSRLALASGLVLINFGVSRGSTGRGSRRNSREDLILVQRQKERENTAAGMKKEQMG